MPSNTQTLRAICKSGQLPHALQTQIPGSIYTKPGMPWMILRAGLPGWIAIWSFTGEGEILRRALNYKVTPYPIYLIPAGQVMARFVREVEARGGVGPVKTRQDLFSDNIHFNDLGAYLVALTHYAVLYQKSPLGLPHTLLRADGSAATDPGPEAGLLMQKIVWDVVTGYAPSGVRRDSSL